VGGKKNWFSKPFSSTSSMGWYELRGLKCLKSSKTMQKYVNLVWKMFKWYKYNLKHYMCSSNILMFYMTEHLWYLLFLHEWVEFSQLLAIFQFDRNKMNVNACWNLAKTLLKPCKSMQKYANMLNVCKNLAKVSIYI
jgi:hypothetical protein